MYNEVHDLKLYYSESREQQEHNFEGLRRSDGSAFSCYLRHNNQHDILVTNITFISGTTEKWRKATESVSLLTARYHYIIIYHSIFRPKLSKNGITSYSKLLLTFPSFSTQSCRFLLIRASYPRMMHNMSSGSVREMSQSPGFGDNP